MVEEFDELVIQISDGTAMGVLLEEEKALLHMRKFRFSGSDPVSFALYELASGYPDKTTINTYWEHTYDLANPTDFSRVIHLIRTNVEENKNWPNTRTQS